MERWQKHIRDRFVILEEFEERPKGVCLYIQTEKGPMEIWCPKGSVERYRYEENGIEIQEVWIPAWLQERARLVERSS